MRRLLIPLAVVALVVVLVIGLTQAGSESGSSDVPQPLSREEVLRPLGGAPRPLAQLHAQTNALVKATERSYGRQVRELRGYPIVVNAWASWCGPCKLEFPIFQRAASRLGKRVAFLGLNVSDNRQDAARYLKKAPVPYPSLLDPDSQILGDAGRGAQALPVTIFYDAQGERRFIHQGGYTEERDLLDDIERHTGA